MQGSGNNRVPSARLRTNHHTVPTGGISPLVGTLRRQRWLGRSVETAHAFQAIL